MIIQLKLNKFNKKLIKLNVKAQNCLNRDKAVKILLKHDKTREKMTKISEGEVRPSKDAVTPLGVSKTQKILINL